MSEVASEVSEASSGKWRGVLARLLLLAVSVSVGIVFAEIALRMVAPVPDPFAAIKDPSRNWFIRTDRAPLDTFLIRAEEGLEGIGPLASYTTNDRGYRGGPMPLPKPAGEYRIVMVGGSTTENRFLDDTETLSTVVETELRRTTGRSDIHVYSAGVAGHRSDDHVSMVGHRVAHQEPDLLIVFAGINDLSAAIYGIDYQHYEAEPTDRAPPLSLSMLVKMLATEWQLPRRLIYLVRRLRNEGGLRVDGEVTTDYASGVARQRAAPMATEPPRTDVPSYVTNLRSLIGMARANGADIVFMTQYTTWNAPDDPSASDWHWMRYSRGVVYDEASMDRAMEEYNDGMRSLADAEGVPLFDLAAYLEKSSAYAFDDVHFTREGARRSGEALAAFLVANVRGVGS